MTLDDYAKRCRPGGVCPAYQDGKYPEMCACRACEERQLSRWVRGGLIGLALSLAALVVMCAQRKRGVAMSIQEHPDYHDGFFDALDGEPLEVLGRSAEYVAGWHGYWLISDELETEDFLGSPDESHLPVFRAQVYH